jgi:recombination associated protein RdgC
MWFKNIILYRLSESLTFSEAQLHDKLYQHLARECGKMEKTTFGWTPPLGKQAEMLVHAVNGCYMIAAKKEEKILPTSVIRDHVLEKIDVIEQEEGRKVSAREKRNLMDEMSITLLPQAFSKSSVTYAYIDTRNNWLVIDTSSRAKAEELTVLLRNSLGSLKLLLPESQQKPSMIMTEWLLNRSMPADFCIEDYCEMINPQSEKTLIKCVNQDLFANEVLTHLAAGKQIMKLAMSWKERLRFFVDHELSIKRIQFLELVQEQVKAVESDSEQMQFDTDFAIFSSEFAAMLKDLFNLFGGCVEQASVQSVVELA